MNEQIIHLIDEEIARLQQARALLNQGAEAAEDILLAGPARPRRTLSPKARRAIAEAQRRRWEKVKALKKAAAPVPAGKKESAAG